MSGDEWLADAQCATKPGWRRRSARRILADASGIGLEFVRYVILHDRTVLSMLSKTFDVSCFSILLTSAAIKVVVRFSCVDKRCASYNEEIKYVRIFFFPSCTSQLYRFFCGKMT